MAGVVHRIEPNRRKDVAPGVYLKAVSVQGHLAGESLSRLTAVGLWFGEGFKTAR